MSELSRYGNDPFGASSENSTVVASVAFALSLVRKPVKADSAADALSGSARRLIDAATSSDVISLPSWNLTPWRILNVHTDASSFGVQLSARRGTALSSESDQTRYSPAWPSTARPPSSATVIGSIAPAGLLIAAVTLPPFCTDWDCWSELVVVPPPPSSPDPHALARKPIAPVDMPSTVPRRTNSRRSIPPFR